MSRLKVFVLRLFIRAAVAYLDIPDGPKDKQVDDWLAGAWMSPGFRKYIAYRNGRIVTELAGGAGLTERTRDDYIRFIGQRAESLIIGAQAKNAYNAWAREQRRKGLSTPDEKGATPA